MRSASAQDDPGIGTSEKEISIDLGNGVNLEMVLIHAGSFMMGDENGLDDEKPVHKVNITKPFYLGKYLVTQEQWEAVMGENPSHFKGSKKPVEQVSWDDCQKFLDKLSAKRGWPWNRFVLPTEAQWEYACRAGSTTHYCCGDDGWGWIDKYAWYGANSQNMTHSVGEKEPNAWGLYDMHGNVYEWCADWYDKDYYAKSSADDPRGPATGLVRVLRGGCWHHFGWFCHSAFRHHESPAGGFYFAGLRVARVPVDNGMVQQLLLDGVER